MKYINASTSKIIPLLAVMLFLAASVFATTSLQRQMFGGTPFFNSAELFLREKLDYFHYSLERTIDTAGSARVGGAITSSSTPQKTAIAIPVLAYHRIVDEADGTDITTDLFKDQMYALKDAGWNTITLAEFEKFIRGEASLPEKSILITFDDGAKKSYYPVDPLLKTLGFNAVSYIIVDSSQVEGSVYYLSPEEISRMLATGRWEIGSHSYNGHTPHAIDSKGNQGHFFSDLLWLPEARRNETPDEFTIRIEEDLHDARASLEKTYGVAIDSLAFPFGDAGETSQNFPEANNIVIDHASKIYGLGFNQVGRGDFSFNYPNSNFLAYRIKVGPTWNGADLLSVLESGLPKDSRYGASLKSTEGWLLGWGNITFNPGSLTLSATPESTSASAVLDGSRWWKSYDAEALVTWTHGDALILANASGSRSYTACAFADGIVRIKTQQKNQDQILKKAAVPEIVSGSNRLIGIRSRGSRISCLWNGEVVLTTDTGGATGGGVGLQVWDPVLGRGSMTVSQFSVRNVE